MYVSAAQPGNMQPIATSDNGKGQTGVRLPIQAFPSRLSPVVQHVTERCHIAKSFCRVSASIAAVVLSMLDSRNGFVRCEQLI